MSTNRDNHAAHIWFLEPPTSQGVLTEEGLDQIVHHQYKAGTYTFIDLQLNSIWQYLTDQLPLWLAPNAVTALGGLFALISYFVTAIYSPDFQQHVPSGVLILNGFCLMAYYTLDCMDGKQARRTASSSPLGQLFDHGCDCLANLSHLSLMQSILRLTPYHYLLLQITMQLGFFQAQIEEYYTGSLPHAAGNLGTTEVLYGMSLWSMATGALELALGWDRNAFYSQSLPATTVFKQIPGMSYILLDIAAATTTTAATSSSASPTLMLRDYAIVIWVYGFGLLVVLSWIRILRYIFCTKQPSGVPTYEMYRLGASAALKWISPMVVCALALSTNMKQNNFFWTTSTTANVRYVSLSLGLCLCILTIKLIVYGMARMAYSSIQWPDLLPWMIVGALTTVQFDDIVLGIRNSKAINDSNDSNDSNINSNSNNNNNVWYILLAVGNLARLLLWTRSAVVPVCQRMNIHLFRIPYSKKKIT